MKSEHFFILLSIGLLIYIFRKKIANWSRGIDSSGSSTGIVKDSQNFIAQQAVDVPSNIQAARDAVSIAIQQNIQTAIIRDTGLQTGTGIDNTILDGLDIATQPLIVDDLLPDTLLRRKRDEPKFIEKLLMRTMEIDDDRQSTLNEFWAPDENPASNIALKNKCCNEPDCGCQINIFQQQTIYN